MEYRPLGGAGLSVSVLGFGCGNVGALMIRGEHQDQIRAIEMAIAAGINYFDTAAQYGNGESERNLGRALRETGHQSYVGTKVRVSPEDADHIQEAVLLSLDESLKRLNRDYVDLIQLHNSIAAQRSSGFLTPEDVLGEVVPAFQRLKQEGKVGAYGFTGLGETEAILRVIETGALATVQCCYNLLNPSAGQRVPLGFPYQDFGQLIVRSAGKGMGALVIRVLAAGALSGSEERHPIASPSVGPIGTGQDYAADVRSAAEFRFLVEQGYARDLVAAAIRSAISNQNLSTVLVGLSSIEHLEHAIAAAERGRLPDAALARLAAVWEGIA